MSVCRENDDYCDLIPIKDWLDCIKHGLFIPYDGSGYFSDGEYRYGDSLYYPPFLNVFTAKPPPWATHVAWYNK